MTLQRKSSTIQLSEEDRLTLESMRKSRTEEKRRTLRAAFLLDSLSGQSDEVIARHHHVSRSTVVLCIQKFLQFGLDAALGELPRPGKPRQLPDDAIAWVQNCACQKPKDLGYSYELWTYQLLTAHVRRRCVAAGHACVRSASRAAEVESFQAPQDPAQGRTSAAQDSILRGAPGSGLRGQNGECAARLQRGGNRQRVSAGPAGARTEHGDD